MNILKTLKQIMENAKPFIRKKPPFWKFWLSNSWWVHLILILGGLVIIKLHYTDPDSMSGLMTPLSLGFVALINIAIVWGSYVSWKK